MHERRRSARFNLRAPVEVMGEGFAMQGTLWDISASGARIEHLPLPLSAGRGLRMRMSYFPGLSEIEFPARVARATEDGGIGVQFSDLTGRAQTALRTLLPTPDLIESF